MRFLKKQVPMAVLLMGLIGGQAWAQDVPKTSFVAAKADGKSGFTTDDGCVAAVLAGKATGYKPVAVRQPDSSYKKTTMAELGYTNGACVQGLTTFEKGVWVYLPPDFEVGARGEMIVMWKCGNAVNRIAKIPVNQTVIRRPASIKFEGFDTAQCNADAAKCAQIEWCNANGGWKLLSVDGVSEEVCYVEKTPRRVITTDRTTFENRHIVETVNRPTEVHLGAEAAPVDVPLQGRVINGVPQQDSFSVGRNVPAKVQGISCTADGKCTWIPTAKRVSEQAAPFCGIETDQGHVIAILDNNGWLQVALNPVFKKNADGVLIVTSAEANHIFSPDNSHTGNGIRMGQFKKNCDAAQAAVESHAGWVMTTTRLNILQCAPKSRTYGPIAQGGYIPRRN